MAETNRARPSFQREVAGQRVGIVMVDHLHAVEQHLDTPDRAAHFDVIGAAHHKWSGVQRFRIDSLEAFGYRSTFLMKPDCSRSRSVQTAPSRTGLQRYTPTVVVGNPEL